jgi:hypothetical protein
VTAVRREAAGLTFVGAAYVAPNGREFLFQGSLPLAKGLKPTMQALARIQMALAPSLTPFFDAWYYPAGEPAREGWECVYRRGEI